MKRIFVTALAFAASALGQDVVSARAGLIQHVEGDVDVDGAAVKMPSREKVFSQLPEVKKGSLLSTAEGRAEILLSPGITLRAGEESTIKMVESKLEDTKVELQKGIAIVEVLEVIKENVVTVYAGNATIEFRKAGTYKIHATGQPELIVYDGLAEMTVAGQVRTVKRGNAVSLENLALARKFDTEKGDALLRWSVRRSGFMAMANVSAASMSTTSMGSNAFYRHGMGNWMWNPYFGMFTYLPYSGRFCNSFIGSCYYSPATVYRAFYVPSYPSPSIGGGGAAGYGGGNTSYSYDQNRGYTVASGGRSYNGISSGASISGGAPAVAAPVADSGGGRSAGGDSGGRGGEGGGRSQ